MIKDITLLSLKNLKKRGIRSWLTMLGIFLGIAAVVSLISLGQGLQTAITGQFTTLSTNILTITSAETSFGPPGATAVKKLTDHDLKLVGSFTGIEIAIPRLVRVAKVEYNSILTFKYMGSMPQTQKEMDVLYESFNLKMAQGRALKEGDTGKVILGDDFVKNDFYGKPIRVGSHITIQGQDFEVIGIMKRASTFILNSVVIIPEKDMKKVLGIGDEVDMIVARVKNEKQTTQIAQDLTKKMRRDRNEKEGEEDFSVQTPVQALASVNTILGIIQIIIAGIAAISLLIGGIGIANTMFTSVLERTKEIGVMKAIGAQNKDILTIFLIEAGLLGLVGGLVGIIIGLGLAFSVSGIAFGFLGDINLKINLSLPLILGSLTFSLLVGIVSGIIPAYQASKLNPVDALRS